LVPLVLGLDKINPRFVIMFYTYFHIEIIWEIDLLCVLVWLGLICCFHRD
jgi:hypothetical protein